MCYSLKQTLNISMKSLLGYFTYLFLLIPLSIWFTFTIFQIILIDEIKLEVGSSSSLLTLSIFNYSMLFGSFILVLLVQSLIINGIYGTCLKAVTQKQVNLSTYFSLSIHQYKKITCFLVFMYIIATIFLVFIYYISYFFSIENPWLLLVIILFCATVLLTPFLHTPIFILNEKKTVWKAIRLSLRLYFRQFFTFFLSGWLFFIPFVFLNGTYFILFYQWLIPNGVLKTVFFFFFMIMIWQVFIFLFSFYFSLLPVVKRYQKHLYHFTAIPEITDPYMTSYADESPQISPEIPTQQTAPIQPFNQPIQYTKSHDPYHQKPPHQ